MFKERPLIWNSGNQEGLPRRKTGTHEPEDGKFLGTLDG
jgi:hypothetical protein